jgi:hypothetical protein
MTLPSQRTSRSIRSGRMNRRPPSFAVTLVALALVFGLAWTFFLRSGPAAPAPVATAVQGTYTWQPLQPSIGQTGTFGAVASGNAGGKARVPEGQTISGYRPTESAYDATTRTETTLGANPGGSTLLTRTAGEWPPIWRVATRSPLDYQGLAAVVRTAVEDGDDTVGIKPLKQGDRVVWRAAMTLGGKQLELVVDRETGIVTWYTDGASTFTATVDWGTSPPATEAYTVAPTVGTKVRPKTVGPYAYAASPAEAGRAAGYDPLVSDLAPDGYALKAAATFAAGYRPEGWVHAAPDGGSGRVRPPAEDAVAQLYTRGLSWFTLQQIGPKASAFFGSSLGDALQTTSPGLLSFQQTTLQYGALKGATASTWYQESGPALFASDARRAVFITGALSRQELIAFAEGLKPAPAHAQP